MNFHVYSYVHAKYHILDVVLQSWYMNIMIWSFKHWYLKDIYNIVITIT